MTGFKYWDGTTWKTITAVPGPAGPAGANGAPGPAAVWSDPNPPPTHDYLWIDTDEPAVAVPIPRSKAYRSAAFTHTSSGGYQKIPLDATAFDDATNSMVDLANGRIYARQSGVYDVFATIQFGISPTGQRGLLIVKNGTTNVLFGNWFSAPTGVGGQAVAAGPLALAAGDYLELQGWQNSGGNLAIATSELNTFLAVELRSADLWAVGATPPTVSALPATPIDGQEVYYLGPPPSYPIWHLRYSTTRWLDGYQWEFLGGTPLRSEIDTSEAINSATYVNAATAGPIVTAPLKGLYDFEYGFNGVIPATAAAYLVASLSTNDGAASDNDAVQAMNAATPAGGYAASASRKRRGGAMLAAGDTVRLKYRQGVGSAGASVRWRYLYATPVRVG